MLIVQKPARIPGVQSCHSRDDRPSAGWIAVWIVLLALPICIMPVTAGTIHMPDPGKTTILLSPSGQYSALFGGTPGIRENLPAVFRYDDREGVWMADNYGQETRIRVMGSGTVILSARSGSFGMQLAGITRGNRADMAEPGRVSVSSNLLESRRADYTEWYLNRDEGIEQGLTLRTRPGGTGPFRVVYALSGNLTPSLDGPALLLGNTKGPVFACSGLAVTDALGRALPVRQILSENTLVWEIDDDGAMYPVTIDPTISQVAILKASDGNFKDYFGTSLALSGDTAIIGAPYADAGGTNKGQAYIYSRNQGGTDQWGQVKILQASDGANNDCFGESVAIDGNTAVVGSICAAPTHTGEAYIFYRNQGGADNWGEVKILTASDASTDANFGESVGVSGDTAVVGAYLADASGAYQNQGQAYVFYRNLGGADNWGQVAILNATDRKTFAQFGRSIAIAGSTVIVGADNATVGANDGQGEAYIFSRNQGGADQWGQVRILAASDGEAGDQLGSSVALDGDTAVIGAMNSTAGGYLYAGKAYIRSKNQGGADTWGEVKILTASDGGSSAFGYGVAITGSRVMVGAPWAGSETADTGKAYLFSRDLGGTNNWGEEQTLQATDRHEWDNFGRAVAANGSTVVSGAYNATVSGTVGQGKAYVFTNMITPTPTPGPQPNGGSDDGPAPARREQRAPVQKPSSTVSVQVGQIGKTPVIRVEVTGIELRDLIVTAQEADGPGTGMHPPPGIVYEYVDLSPARFIEITDAKILFVVPLAWITEHQLAPEDIVLYHSNGKDWEALPTMLTAIKEGEAYYTAEGSGFSRFAITGQVNLTGSAGNVTPAATTPAYRAPVQTSGSMTPVPGTPVITATTAVPAMQPASEGFPSAILLIVGGAIVILVAAVLIRRWIIRRQNPALFEKYD